MSETFSTKEYAVFTIGLILIVLGVLFGINKYTETPDLYAGLPEELKLKAEPTEIIYTEAYREGPEQNAIKYAYIGDEVAPDEGEDVARRTSESKTFVLERFEDEEGTPMEKLRTEFISKPQYYNDGETWRQIEYATTTEEVFSLSGAKYHVKKREFVERLASFIFDIKPVFAQSSTFYPDPNTETSSVDGQVTGYSDLGVTISAVYSDARNQLSGISSSDTSTTFSASSYIFSDGQRGGLTEAQIVRGFLLFDTSSLGSGAVVSAATLSVWPTSKANNHNDGLDYITVVSSAPVSNTSLANLDYSSIGTTAFSSSVDITGLSTGAYHNFTLNSSGIANISTTGVSKFGIREGHDFVGTAPLSPNGTTGVQMSAAETSGTTQDPKLAVTYTVEADFSFGQWFPF